MKCEKCRKHDATVHVTTIHNGDKREHHLCETCAGKNEYGSMMWQQFNLWDNEFFKSLMAPGVYPADEGTRCDGCGMSYRDFTRSGKLGCPSCYRQFSAKLAPIIKRWQGAARHVGKAPVQAEEGFRASRELYRLRQELMQAVATEEYERAARLRDEIKQREEQTKAKEAGENGH